MEPCGSGSLHVRSRVMLHLNSHNSRETTSNSSTGKTAPAAASNADTRQISCPNISNDDQSQKEKKEKNARAPVRAVDEFSVMERLQKLWNTQEGPFTRSSDIYGIRIGDYIRLHLTWASWREEIYTAFSRSSFTEEDKKLTTIPNSFTSCMRWHVFHPSLSTFSWGATPGTALFSLTLTANLNLRLWEVRKRAQICA